MLNQTPNYSPITVAKGETVSLTAEFEHEKPSAARTLVDGEEVTQTELSPGASEWTFEFSHTNTGQYEVEIIVEGEFPDRLGAVYEQDALSIDDTEMHAEWVVVVESGKNRSLVGRALGAVKDGLVFYTFLDFLHRVSGVVRDTRDSLEGAESEEEDAADVNATLDEFVEDDSTEKDDGVDG